jgi:5-methylcytosine-specific restriction enzyme subunit McrC
MNRTTDNNQGNFEVKTDIDLQNLIPISHKNLKDLETENSNLLIFPPKHKRHKDDIEKLPIFALNGNKLETNNFMGFVSFNETQLTISSRFYANNDDYFLHYMLQKVFNINVLDFKFSTENDNIWDIFLIYLFPFYLKKALNQGLYKEYQRQQYNNPNVKGLINIARHIKQNIPFMGNIAYDMREHTYDNRITQLIRHTIEYIKNHKIANGILNNHYEIKEAVSQITFATPTYERNQRLKTIIQNEKNVHHPFFTEYEFLRKICLKILNKQGLSFGQNQKDKVYGLVFDGAWLWEEYLNTILKKLNFIHPQNKTGKNPIYLFCGNRNVVYPDFYKPNVVLDAKYKHLENGINKTDLYQLISYLHILEAKNGGFIFPKEDENLIEDIGVLNGFGGTIKSYGVKIPLHVTNYLMFKEKMVETEKILIDAINLMK